MPKTDWMKCSDVGNLRSWDYHTDWATLTLYQISDGSFWLACNETQLYEYDLGTIDLEEAKRLAFAAIHSQCEAKRSYLKGLADEMETLMAYQKQEE